MALVFHLQFEEDSRQARVIQTIAERQHITPQEVAQRLLEEAIEAQTHPTPAEELLGAFSGPEDRKAVDDAMGFVRDNRKDYDVIRDFGI